MYAIQEGVCAIPERHKGVAKSRLPRVQTLENIASDPEDPIAELYERKMGHLTDADKDFFVRWEQLITLEEQETIHHKNQVWTSTAAEREKSGR